MKTRLSLRRVIALAVVAGLLLPALFGGWLTLQRQRTALTAALESELQHVATLLANGLAPSVWSLNNDSIQALFNAAAVDRRVVRITLLDSGGSTALKMLRDIPGFDRPERQLARLLAVTKPVVWQGTEIAGVQLEMDTGQLEARLKQDLEAFLVIAAAQIALSLSLIMLILNLRFVAPLRRLLRESTQLARRELDLPFVWNRRDELGTLGNSLDSTRIALQAAFKESAENEQRFRSLTNLSSDWYWERDADDRMLAISQGFQDITGIDPNPLLGTRRGEFDAVLFPSNEHWIACQEKIAARLPFYEMEWQAMHPDGQMRYGSISGEPIFDADGSFRGYRGIGKDLTAAKLAEVAQNSVARLRQLVEHLPAGAIYIEGGATLLNQAAEQITGYPRSEMSSTAQWFETLFGQDAEYYRQQYHADKLAGFPAPREIEIVRKDGARRTVEFAAYGEDGNEVWLLHDLSQRVLAEAALQETLREQQILLDNALVGIQFVRDRLMQRCNRGFEQMLGYAPGELAGQPTRIYYASDESYEQHGRLVYPQLQAGAAATGEWEYQRKDGLRIWCSYQGQAVDPKDPGKGSIWVEQNITERKRAEQALQLTLLEQRAILDNATVGIAFTMNRVFQACNREFELMLGYAPNELLGKPTHFVYPSADAYAELGRIAIPLLGTGQRLDTELLLMKRDGTQFWCRMLAKAIDPDDTAKGTIFIIEDIAERKRAEDALKQALLEQQALLDNSAIGIAFVKNRVIVRGNSGVEQILGYASGELNGKSTRCFYPSDETYEMIGAKLHSLMQAGEVFSADLQLQRKDGAKVWCSVNAKALDPGWPEEGVVTVLQDISARKQAEDALVESKNRLELGLAEVEQTHREVTLLGELSSFLQACQSAQEAYDSLVSYAPRLFPGSSGALYLIDDSAELAVQANWGEPAHAAANFLPGDCWALRRGQSYRMDDPVNGLCCPHLHGGGARSFSYACLPLVAQGETFGLLFIEYRLSLEDDGKREMRHRLAVALAEQAGLALANIRLREALHLQSIRDPLTGLYNRRYMNDVMRRELSRARRSRDSLAVAIIDIDFFKHFNDSFGHDAGDYVLQHVAKLLETCVRQSDVVCRFGGEEFVLLMPEISCELAEQRAGELLVAVRRLDLTHGNRTLGPITVSLGMALYPLHGESSEVLLAAADSALYQAKESGRNRYIIVDSAG